MPLVLARLIQRAGPYTCCQCWAVQEAAARPQGLPAWAPVHWIGLTAAAPLHAPLRGPSCPLAHLTAEAGEPRGDTRRPGFRLSASAEGQGPQEPGQMCGGWAGKGCRAVCSPWQGPVGQLQDITLPGAGSIRLSVSTVAREGSSCLAHPAPVATQRASLAACGRLCAAEPACLLHRDHRVDAGQEGVSTCVIGCIVTRALSSN